MQSCSSPISSASAKKTGNPISLNGLFGETYGFEDTVHTSLQSPVYNPFSNNKINSISPSKSLSVELNYNQQPVLLSELADGNLLASSGGSGLLLKGNALCSYVSPFDNSRCTNLAETKLNATKSFCPTHLKQPSALSFKKTNKPSTKLKKSVPKPSRSTAVSSIRKLNSQLVDHRIPNPTLSITSGAVNGVDVRDGQAATPFPLTAASNIMFPISYINAQTNQLAGTKTKTTHQNVLNAVPVSTAKQKAIQRTPTSMQVKQETARTKVNNNVLPMDHDVLQAFVDFLNQNHDKLSPKQQLNLLNSLGVTVATVKNPDDYCSMVHYQQPKASNFVQNRAYKSNCSASCLPAAVVSDQCHHARPNALKRKPPLEKDRSSLKKMKTIDHFASNSLQHLTFEKQDEVVLDTLTSIGGKSKPKSPTLKTGRKSKVKPDPKPTSSKSESSKVPLPTVSIPMNRSKTQELLKKDFSNSFLKNYVELEVDKEIKSQSLFSIGPFCDDTDALVCTCKSSQQIIPVRSRAKQKATKKTKHIEKTCSKCNFVNTKHPLLNFFNTSLASTRSLQEKIFEDNRNCCSKKDAQASDGVLLNGFSSESVAMRCRHLSNGTKVWKKLLKDENKSIKELAKAVQSNTTECVQTVKRFGHQNPTCLQKKKKIGCMPSKCTLTDRTGNQCPNDTLPFSFYCRDHIMHSNSQQLFKLGPSMNVIADIFPDPPLVRQRKKTKLPPLSKRKKRRVKKRNKDLGTKSATQNQNEESIVDEKSSPSGATKPNNLFHMSLTQPEISDYVVDNNDEILTASNAVQMPSVIDDPPLSPETNLLNNNLPSNAYEDSDSAIFEAFNFDGEEFLHDVTPDMFSELNLDNAFLLTGSGDPIDKLSFEELKDSEPIFSTSDLEITTPIPFPEKDQITPSTLELPLSKQCSLETASMDANSAGQMDSSQASFSSNSPTINWPPKPLENADKAIFTSNNAGVEDVATSTRLDTSFAEDLNEIEGVIQSLQDETLKPSVADTRKNWSVDDYKNSLKHDASVNMQERRTENRNISEEKTSHQFQISSLTSKSHQGVTSVLHSTNPIFSTTQIVNQINNLQTTNLVLTPVHQPAVLQRTVNQKPKDASKIICSKVTKKPRTKSSPRKRGNLFTVRQNGLPPNGMLSTSTKIQVAASTAQTKLSSAHVTAKAAEVPKIFPERTKNGKKPKAIIASPTSKPNNAAYPIRMQPKLLSAATGKTANQSMILIPINAMVRSPNQVHATNQNLGIAFAIPSQNLGANNLMQIRGSAFLASTNNNQQVLILGATPTNNVQLSTNLNINPTLFQGSSTSIARSQPNSAMPKSTTVHSFNFTEKTKPCVNEHFTQSRVVSSVIQPISRIPTSPGEASAGYVNKKPFKKQFHKDSIVIPPALINGTKKVCESRKTDSVTNKHNFVPAKPLRARSLETSSTVHWNKTITTAPPPTPQRPPDGIGGQTSNMLFCRRINPALNPHQQVVVGKLGSLARINRPRLDAEKEDRSVKVKPDTSRIMSQSSAQQSDASPASVTENDKVLNPCKAGREPWKSSQLRLTKSTPSSPIPTDTSSSQLRDVSNQLLHITPEVASRESGTNSSPLSDSIARHGSRKSDHSQMLKDPDFCESPTGCNSSKELTNDIAQNCGGSECVLFGAKPSGIDASETSTAVTEEKTKDSGLSLASNKVQKRAAILRKR